MSEPVGTPVSPDYICRYFDRAPVSLIEEPEICENCALYDGGLCRREEESDGRT